MSHVIMKLSYSIIFIIIHLIHSVALENNETFLYYAYGSNLLAKRVHINNPTATFYGIAKLRDHRLDFIKYTETWNGAVATIVEEPGTDMWGALWILNIIDMKHLDIQEGVDDDFYFAKNVTVVTPDGATLEARTYQQTINPPKAPSCCIPSDRRPSNTYMNVILYGAFECRLPMSYIRYLFTFPTNNKVATTSLRQHLGYPFNRTETD